MSPPNKLNAIIDIPVDHPFSIYNLPFGVFAPSNESPRVGVAIGDEVLDLAVLQEKGHLSAPALRGLSVFDRPDLNAFMALGRPAWQATRTAVQRMLSADNPLFLNDEGLRQRAFWSQKSVQMHLPAAIGDYTDFYSSREHATNVGTMFRGPENALMPNWLHLPVGYHGRASSVVLSGVDIRRPRGQTLPAGASVPQFTSSQRLDFELEMGFFVGPGNELGVPITVRDAYKHIFGLVLVNDWSARDIQKWEYQPLGPFLAKNFATSISPWVVTLDALEPFRVPGPEQSPEPLPYLRSRDNWTYDIKLEVSLQAVGMSKPVVVARSNFRHLYWNMCQQLAHHTITGCNARPGDLLATGTISGPTPDSYGSMLELAWRGERPLKLPDGRQRTFLEDGDRVTMRGWCQGEGYRVGLGEVTAVVLPANDS